jgi:cysteine desulfurase
MPLPPGYLDYASTAPLHPVARDALLAAYDDGWADPSRLYGAARRARILLDDARGRVAAALGRGPTRSASPHPVRRPCTRRCSAR